MVHTFSTGGSEGSHLQHRGGGSEGSQCELCELHTFSTERGRLHNSYWQREWKVNIYDSEVIWTHGTRKGCVKSERGM